MADTPRQIADAIGAAIMAQRLPPGTKLGERELAEIWETSRAVIKQALIIVSASGLVETRPNRGASVAQLTQREAYELFEALTAVEQGAAFLLMKQLSSREWDVLQEHVDQTQSHMDHDDNASADRIGPQFHDLLMSLTRNRSLQESHARLVRRTQLLRQLYINRSYHRCRLNDDHQALVEHLRSGRAEEALTLIDSHYQAIARGYDLEGTVQPPESIATALAPWIKTETATV